MISERLHIGIPDRPRGVERKGNPLSPQAIDEKVMQLMGGVSVDHKGTFQSKELTVRVEHFDTRWLPREDGYRPRCTQKVAEVSVNGFVLALRSRFDLVPAKQLDEEDLVLSRRSGLHLIQEEQSDKGDSMLFSSYELFGKDQERGDVSVYYEVENQGGKQKVSPPVLKTGVYQGETGNLEPEEQQRIARILGIR